MYTYISVCGRGAKAVHGFCYLFGSINLCASLKENTPREAREKAPRFICQTARISRIDAAPVSTAPTEVSTSER